MMLEYKIYVVFWEKENSHFLSESWMIPNPNLFAWYEAGAG